jgi:hypothetical protein
MHTEATARAARAPKNPPVRPAGGRFVRLELAFLNVPAATKQRLNVSNPNAVALPPIKNRRPQLVCCSQLLVTLRYLAF